MLEEILRLTEESMCTFRQYKHFEILISLNQCIHQTQCVSRIHSFIHRTGKQQQAVLVILYQLLIRTDTSTTTNWMLFSL